MPLPSFESYARLVLDPAGIPYSVEAEAENADYQAGLARIGDQLWRIRTAKITPTKPGAFVSVWRRAADGSTEAFPLDDRADGLLVFVSNQHRSGVFRFSRKLLGELGISSSSTKAGKRGFRVYPAWCTGLNPQATRTQRAQAPAFEELTFQ